MKPMMKRNVCPTCGNKAYSQQRDWQMKQIELGNCTCCGKPNDLKPRRHCSICAEKKRIKQRERAKR